MPLKSLYMHYTRTHVWRPRLWWSSCARERHSPSTRKCMFTSESTTSYPGQPAVQTGTRFCIYRLRGWCSDDTDGLLHAWAALTEASVRGSRPRRHITGSSSVRRPSLPVLLRDSAHSGHYTCSLSLNTPDGAAAVPSTPCGCMCSIFGF